MKRALRVHRTNYPPYEFSNWHAVWIIKEHKHSYRIWAWRFPFTRLLHKGALGERIEDL